MSSFVIVLVCDQKAIFRMHLFGHAEISNSKLVQTCSSEFLLSSTVLPPTWGLHNLQGTQSSFVNTIRVPSACAGFIPKRNHMLMNNPDCVQRRDLLIFGLVISDTSACLSVWEDNADVTPDQFHACHTNLVCENLAKKTFFNTMHHFAQSMQHLSQTQLSLTSKIYLSKCKNLHFEPHHSRANLQEINLRLQNFRKSKGHRLHTQVAALATCRRPHRDEK